MLLLLLRFLQMFFPNLRPGIPHLRSRMAMIGGQSPCMQHPKNARCIFFPEDRVYSFHHDHQNNMIMTAFY